MTPLTSKNIQTRYRPSADASDNFNLGKIITLNVPTLAILKNERPTFTPSFPLHPSFFSVMDFTRPGAGKGCTTRVFFRLYICILHYTHRNNHQRRVERCIKLKNFHFGQTYHQVTYLLPIPTSSILKKQRPISFSTYTRLLHFASLG